MLYSAKLNGFVGWKYLSENTRKTERKKTSKNKQKCDLFQKKITQYFQRLDYLIKIYLFSRHHVFVRLIKFFDELLFISLLLVCIENQIIFSKTN